MSALQAHVDDYLRLRRVPADLGDRGGLPTHGIGQDPQAPAP